MDEILAAGVKAVRSSILAMVTMLIAPGTMRAQQGTEPYPFAVGNYWIYRGYVTETATYDQGRWLPPETKQRTWRSEITQVVYRKKGSEVRGALSSRISAAVFDDIVMPEMMIGCKPSIHSLFSVPGAKIRTIMNPSRRSFRW